MSVARFRIVGRLDKGGSSTEGTVTIERTTGLFGVRSKRRRRVYRLPLATVADMVVAKIVKAEVRERLAQRGRGKRGKR